ncbi:MAG: hypothetical protein GX660_26525 [Clostridiaceae bacterium]|nr:hypothetical protein [Clostridiaceae bacterium]
MIKEADSYENTQNTGISNEIIYNPEKDFYKGAAGELRMKAEGLFKKAKEKGISIEDISIELLKENRTEFPGLGTVELPAYIVKVRGKDMSGGQIIVDGKLIDYYNRYQKYLAQKIEDKNVLRKEDGRLQYENRKPKIIENPDFILTDWEKFEIGSELLDDKEFGIEKTITGACDRIIRKLMGENDWLYPDEARLLDEEFTAVQNKIAVEAQDKKNTASTAKKKATPRQISYLRQKLKSMGIEPDGPQVISGILRELGFDPADINELSVGDMSKVIDSLGSVVPRIKDNLASRGNVAEISDQAIDGNENSISQ